MLTTLRRKPDVLERSKPSVAARSEPNVLATRNKRSKPGAMIEKAPTKLRLKKVRKNHLQINLKVITTILITMILIAIFVTKTAAIKPIPTHSTEEDDSDTSYEPSTTTRKSLPSLKKSPSRSSCAAVNVTNSHVIVNAEWTSVRVES